MCKTANMIILRRDVLFVYSNTNDWWGCYRDIYSKGEPYYSIYDTYIPPKDYRVDSNADRDNRILRAVSAALKSFVSELAAELKNGTLVFNEMELQNRIDELFSAQIGEPNGR